MKNRNAFLMVGIFAIVQAVAFGSLAAPPFPQNPNPQVTPGSVCAQAESYRYPERIKYCNRDVESELKREIIRDYDRQFGHQIGRMDRMKFKIDHLIPLCAGGSNERDNLWPQHVSVYNVTDPLEPLLCEKMAAGRLRQADAIRMIKEAKADLSKVRNILTALQRL